MASIKKAIIFFSYVNQLIWNTLYSRTTLVFPNIKNTSQVTEKYSNPRMGDST